MSTGKYLANLEELLNIIKGDIVENICGDPCSAIQPQLGSTQVIEVARKEKVSCGGATATPRVHPYYCSIVQNKHVILCPKYPQSTAFGELR
eukprot:scaffold20932_cov83-Skeletonema_menzelii.AAC.1